MRDEQVELRFITLGEAAGMFQVSKRTLLRMIRQGGVPPFIKVGGQWRIRESQLKRWVEHKENGVAELGEIRE